MNAARIAIADCHGHSPFMARRARIFQGKGELWLSRDLAAIVWRLSRLLCSFIKEMEQID
jgi:hypothetical protein